MRAFVRNAGVVYAAQLVNAALSIVFVPVALQRMGPDQYGLFGIYGVIVVYLALAELGLGKNLTRAVAMQHNDAGRAAQVRLALAGYIAVAAVLLLLLPLIVVAIPAVVFPVPATAVVPLRWITAIAVAEYIAGIPIMLRVTHAVAMERFDRYSSFQFASGFVRYALAFTVLAVYPDPVLLAGAVAGRRLVEFALAPWLLGRLPPGSWRPTLRRQEVTVLFRQTVALFIGQVLQVTVVSVGAVLVNRAYGLASLGVYRAVFDLVSKIWLFANVIAMVAYPRFVRQLHDPAGRRHLVRVLPNALVMSWAGYCMVALLAAALAPAVLDLFAMRGPVFLGLLVLMAAGVAFNAHANVALELVTATGRYWHTVLLGALSLVLLVGVFAYLAGPRALLAIGWAWLLSQAVAAIAADTLGTVIVGAARRRDPLIKLIFAAIVTGAAWWRIAPLAASVGTALLSAGIIGAVAAGVVARRSYLSSPPSAAA